MKRIRRKLAMLFVLLCGGAIINIVVAWGCVVATSSLTETWDEDSFASPEPFVMRMAGRHSANSHSKILRYKGAATEYLMTNVSFLTASDSFDADVIGEIQRILVISGWPCWSMSGERWQETLDGKDPDPDTDRVWYEWSIRLRAEEEDPPRMIALRPVFLGFAINTIFYAGILWLLFAAPGFVRRRYRIKRGLCPSCAYPVGESDLCTECGNPLRRRT